MIRRTPMPQKHGGSLIFQSISNKPGRDARLVCPLVYNVSVSCQHLLSLRHPCLVECGNLVERNLVETVVEVGMGSISDY